MLPILFKIGPIPFHSYGLMIAIGFLVALYLAQREARRAGIDPDTIANGAFGALLTGLIAARLSYIIMFPQSYSWTDPIGWIAIWQGGLVFQGGIIPVFLFALWYLRKNNEDFWAVMDIATPYAALAHGIGRIGCFMYGCCYGVRTNLPWGIPFPAGSPVFQDHLFRYSGLSSASRWSFPVHPTQLYSLAALAGICLVLLLLKKTWCPFKGFVFPVYLVLYGVYRLLVEFLRADHNPTHFHGALTDQQVFSILSIVAGIVLFFFLRRRAAAKSAQAH